MQSKLQPAAVYYDMARVAAEKLEQVLRNATPKKPPIKRSARLVQNQGRVWLFVYMQVATAGKVGPLVSPSTMAEIRAATGHPRAYVDANVRRGLLTYALLLNAPPKLPTDIEYPSGRAGLALLGLSHSGEVSTPWDSLGHVLIAGMTGSGKSNLMRLLANQAVEQDHELALADPGGLTFGPLMDHPANFAPPAESLDDCAELIRRAQNEFNDRVHLYKNLPSHGQPDSIDTYNAEAAKQGQPLKRLFVFIDEFTAVMRHLKGKQGINQIEALALRGRKYGIHLVLATQAATRLDLGLARDQCRTRICFRVMSPATSRMLLQRSGAENIKQPGRALTNRWGMIQTYRLAAAAITPSTGSDGLTNRERAIVAAVWESHGGRLTFKALTEQGMSRSQARGLRTDFLARGLARHAPEADNSIMLIVNAPVTV